MSRSILNRHIVTLSPATHRHATAGAIVHIAQPARGASTSRQAYCGVWLAGPEHHRADRAATTTCARCRSVYRHLPHPEILAARARTQRRRQQIATMTALLGPQLSAWRPTRHHQPTHQLALFDFPTMPTP